MGFLPRRPPRSLLVTALPFALVTLSCLLGASAQTKPRRFVNAGLGLSGEVPAGWELSVHTGYPWVAALLLRGEGNRLWVAAQPCSTADLHTFVARNRQALEEAGVQMLEMKARTGGWLELSARVPRRGEVLRQAYLLREYQGSPQAVVLTATCPQTEAPACQQAFDQVLKRLSLDDNEPPPAGDEGSPPEKAQEKQSAAPGPAHRGPGPNKGAPRPANAENNTPSSPGIVKARESR